MAPAAGSGTEVVRALLARRQRDPNLIASVLQGNPGAVAEIVAPLNQTLGNRFVQAVLSAFEQADESAATPKAVEPEPAPVAPTPVAPPLANRSARRSRS